MPPFGRDEQVQAQHVLNVMDAAKTLAAAIAQAGGLAHATMENPAVSDAVKLLFEQTSKLQVYEMRGRARGTLVALDDEKVAEAIQQIRSERVMTGQMQDVFAMAPTEVAETFSLDAEPVRPPETMTGMFSLFDDEPITTTGETVDETPSEPPESHERVDAPVDFEVPVDTDPFSL